MKSTNLFFGVCLSALAGILPVGAMNNQPDSLLLFAYATDLNGNRDGLHFAWSADGDTWHRIGNRYGFVKSDYGPWGAGGEKRMLDPVLERRPDGSWRCSWSVNERDGVLAHTESADLLLWKPQDYYPETDLRGPDRSVERQTVTFPDGVRESGRILRVERAVIDRLIGHWQRQQFRRSQNAELMRDDPVRFAGLGEVSVTVTARPEATKPI
ncbi:MAG: alpha-L-arabinofuranosidase, partial [Alistipes sp.]|nr:alpha-L-arabinofuranosidase [Alistipes sp.]